MTSLNCDICFELYSELRLPKVLDCGHTLCSLCLANLFQSKKDCPTCRRALTRSLREYPINYIVLQQINDVQGESKISIVTKQLKDLEKLLLKRKGSMVQRIEQITKLNAKAIYNLSRIQQMLEKDESSLIVTDAEELIKELKVFIGEADAVMIHLSGEAEPAPSFSLNECSNSHTFLHLIANRLEKGETIFAYKILPSWKSKYGKLSLNKDRIDIHCLDAPTIDKKVSLVSFMDLKRSCKSDNFRTFIEFGTNRLIFSIIDSSYLAVRFITLCSGERGPVFLRAKHEYRTGCKSSIPENDRRRTPGMNDDVTECIQIEYMPDILTGSFDDYILTYFTGEKVTKCSVGDVVVQLLPLGEKCTIEKCFSEGQIFKNVVAKLDFQSVGDFYKIESPIRDCGISIIL